MKSPVYSAEFDPPIYNSAPEDESLNENTESATCPSDTRVWKTGLAPYDEIDWKAIPIKPSAGNCELSNPEEYVVAAPSV